MMQFPLNDGGVFAIIEPGNIQRLREGRPLHVGNVMIAFTPDMMKLAALLGASGELPAKGERKEYHVKLTPEQIQAALDACKNEPEVAR